MTNSDPSEATPGLRLLALSFIALFLELMVIRWIPSVVLLVAYYSNLLLISSFFGLGVGAMLSTRKERLFHWFPLMLALYIGLLLLCQQAVMPGSTSEVRFFTHIPRLTNYLVLISIFTLNAVIFVPLGQEIGSLFHALPTLKAYSWDLGGSLCGTLVFGLFSLFYFSPLLGMAMVMLIFLGLSLRGQWLWSLFLFALILAGMHFSGAQSVIWSPYYYITVHQAITSSNGQNKGNRTVQGPAPGLHTMDDPPIYVVQVNQHFYQMHGSIQSDRYTLDSPAAQLVAFLRDQYLLPYALSDGRKRVAVMGAGGGMDVEAALLSGAEQVDAVEIDPVLIQLSRRFNAGAVYDDPRVTVHINDARAFLRRAEPGYDLIAYGFLDSQALFTSMSNLRLDGFTYTVEGFRFAYQLLNDNGVLSISFAVGQKWMAEKLFGMVEEATGKKPLVYLDAGQIILLAFRGDPPAQAPTSFGRFRHTSGDAGQVDLATDDWPYLYLSKKTVPEDYRIVIGILLLASLATVLALRGTAVGLKDGHFFFLGWGFLLLQTKSISDCSLYFGTTWFVTMLVVAGVLLMVLAANTVATRMKRFSFALYLPLFASLGALFLVPSDLILSLPFAGRLLWTLLAVPLPVFFAGLIFSTTFRDAAVPSAVFGANLIGAMVGGFSEYLGMVMGSRMLSLLVMAVYGCSLVCLMMGGRRSSAPELEPSGGP